MRTYSRLLSTFVIGALLSAATFAQQRASSATKTQTAATTGSKDRIATPSSTKANRTVYPDLLMMILLIAVFTVSNSFLTTIILKTKPEGRRWVPW